MENKFIRLLYNIIKAMINEWNDMIDQEARTNYLTRK